MFSLHVQSCMNACAKLAIGLCLYLCPFSFVFLHVSFTFRYGRVPSTVNSKLDWNDILAAIFEAK